MTAWLEKIQVSEEQYLNNKSKVPVIWISALECTGCIEAFTRTVEPNAQEVLIDLISLEYSDLLSTASGTQFSSHLQQIHEKYKGEYILMVEGSVPLQDEFLMSGGKSVKQEIIELAKHARAVIGVGSCASWGGLPSALPNPTEAMGIEAILPEETPLVLIPGCAPIPEVMVGTIMYIHFHKELPELDKKKRPKLFYASTVHMQCHRKPYFDQKLFRESYEDETNKDYCLFKIGCKGPQAFNSCESIGNNSCIKAGYTCIACSEKGFWEKGSFYKVKVAK